MLYHLVHNSLSILLSRVTPDVFESQPLLRFAVEPGAEAGQFVYRVPFAIAAALVAVVRPVVAQEPALSRTPPKSGCRKRSTASPPRSPARSPDQSRDQGRGSAVGSRNPPCHARSHEPHHRHQTEAQSRLGCGFLLVSAVLTCILLGINGLIVMNVVTAVMPLFSEVAQRPRLAQAAVFLGPVVLLFIEWWICDVTLDWLQPQRRHTNPKRQRGTA